MKVSTEATTPESKTDLPTGPHPTEDQHRDAVAQWVDTNRYYRGASIIAYHSLVATNLKGVRKGRRLLDVGVSPERTDRVSEFCMAFVESVAQSGIGRPGEQVRASTTFDVHDQDGEKHEFRVVALVSDRFVFALGYWVGDPISKSATRILRTQAADLKKMEKLAAKKNPLENTVETPPAEVPVLTTSPAVPVDTPPAPRSAL